MRTWPMGAFVIALAITPAGIAVAAQLQAEVKEATPAGSGAARGTVTISDSPQGAVFETALQGLPPGPHGFHVHENGSCDATTMNGNQVPAGAAGGHLDPQHTGHHEGPEGHGHLGDLPVLQVAPDGNAKQKLTAPMIKDVSALQGKALMIHAGGDNYSDQPAPLGGGGARIACGVIH